MSDEETDSERNWLTWKLGLLTIILFIMNPPNAPGFAAALGALLGSLIGAFILKAIWVGIRDGLKIMAKSAP